MNKYEVYDKFVKIGPYYEYICFGSSRNCKDCEFEKRVESSRCSYNALSNRLFGRTYMANWHEVQELVQTLFEEGV